MKSGWPIYLINLDRDTERLATSFAQLHRLGLQAERIAAIDGATLGAAEQVDVYDAEANRSRFKHDLVAGEIGCYLSHIAVWRRLAASGAPGAIVLEDDFNASDTLPGILTALQADPDPWDMVKLAMRRADAPLLAGKPLGQAARLVRPRQVPNTTLGYVIRRKAALHLLDIVPPFARPIDEDLKHVWETGLDIRAVLPAPLCSMAQAADSGAISTARKRWGNPWRGLKYRMRFRRAQARHLAEIRQ